MNQKKTFVICLLLLVGCGLITMLIFMTEPRAQRSGAVKKTAMLVTVTQVDRGNFRPQIQALGTVEAAQDVVLQPRVAGEILSTSPAFVPGGYVKKGDVLLQIDPADYQNALAQRKSDLSQAMADLDIEIGRQTVAQQDYQLHSNLLSDENKALVLREPQLKAARARVEAARADVAQAERDLQRTTLRAPFDAHILSQNAYVGSQVSQGTDLGRLVGMDHYWVIATVPVAALRWLSIPQGESEGPLVRIRNRTVWDDGVYREGRVLRLVGALESQTRMARVLVNVPDPHGYRTGVTDAPPLMIGAFVSAEIEAEEIPNVVRLNRDYVRDNGKVWVMDDGVLRIRDVHIVFQDAVHAYITEGLQDGDWVVTSDLSTVVDGAPLRVEE